MAPGVTRRVRGVLFVDYVRMIRSAKNVDWSKYLHPEDLDIAQAEIAPDAWYPMESFERYGVGILTEIARGQLAAVRMWGRFQLDGARLVHPSLVAPGEPRETMMRFQVLRKTFFDFDAVKLVTVDEDSASIAVAYGMGKVAEEAASHQTVGFFERLVEVAGGKDVYARLTTCSWLGDAATRIDVDWRT